MKRLLPLILIITLFLQSSVGASAFTDSINSPFIAKKYTHDDKFLNYEILNGVDVSQWQSSADFEKVKAAGADFVILRAACRGYSAKGTLFKDDKFDEYVQAADKAGLDIGAYIYSQAITVKEAQEEADYILNIVKGYNITLPIVFDFEYASPSTSRLRAAKLSVKEKTDICNAFCAKVESAGYTAMVYANQSMLTNDLNDDEIAKKYDIWLANYSTVPKLSGKMYDCDYTYWQYTSSGKANGLPGSIDCNFRYFKKPNKVSGLKIKNETISSLSLSWSKVKGCYGYQIYKLNPETGKYSKIGTTKGAAKTSFTDKNSQGLPGEYKVRAITAYKDGFASGSFSSVIKSTGIFLINEKSFGTGYFTFDWIDYPNASEYEVYRSASENDGFVKIASLEPSTTTFTDYTKSGFKTYYYKVRAVTKDENNNIIAEQYTPVKKVVKQQPKLKSVYLKTNSSAQINWNTVNGASGTVIYRKSNNGNFKKIKTIKNNKTTSYTDKNLKKGVKYTYQIRQYVTSSGKNYYSDYTSKKSVNPMKTTSVTLKAAKKSIKITYQKVTGASGYEIYMKPYKGKYSRIKTTSKTSYTKKGLKAGKKYFIKVRAYKNANGKKVYASFSSAKSIKALY